MTFKNWVLVPVPVFDGSFAQLFTQDLASVASDRLADAVVMSVMESTNRPLHVSLFWFAVKQVRKHYRRQETGLDGKEIKLRTSGSSRFCLKFLSFPA